MGGWVRKFITKVGFIVVSLSLLTPKVFARGQYFNYVNRGGSSVSTSSQQSLTKVQRSFPGATVKVCLAGTSCTASTGTLATLYSDVGGTAKANPFTAGTDGSFSFFIDISAFDIVFYGTGITTSCGAAGQLSCISAFSWTNQSTVNTSSSSTVFNVKDYGAKGDYRHVTDGAITNGSTTLSSATAAFTTNDVGKEIEIGGAGVAGAVLYSSIATFVSSTQVTTALAASTSVTGATVKVYTDDGAAVILAATALATNKGGTLEFPPSSPENTYGLYGKGTSYGILGTFTSLNNINLICDGCVLYFSGEHTVASSGGSVFRFSSTTNITVDGFDVVGELTAAGAQSGSFRGMEFLEFLSGNVQVNIPRIRGRNIGALVIIDNNTGGLTFNDPHTRNIHIGLLECTVCVYGLNAQFSGDDMVIDMMKTDTVLRSFYIYGTSNIYAKIHSKDATGNDVELAGFGGHGLSNINIDYSSDATSTARSSNAMVALDYFETTPIAMNNIRINYDVVFPGSGTANTGGPIFMIHKYSNASSTVDTTDRGHTLDGLTLSGRVENYSASPFGLIDVDNNSQWGPTLDAWYNIKLDNLHFVNNGKYARLSLRALKGSLLVSNFTSNGDLILVESNYSGAADTGFPHNGVTKVVNSSYTNIWTFDGVTGALPSGVVWTSGSVNVQTGWQDQIINNAGAGGTTTLTLPASSIGQRYTFSRVVAQTFRIAPQAADQIRGASAANKYISIDTTGVRITLVCTAAGFWDVLYYGPTTDISFQP